MTQRTASASARTLQYACAKSNPYGHPASTRKVASLAAVSRVKSAAMKSSSRVLILATAGLLLVSSVQDLMAAKFKGPIGLQLYSLRADFAKNVPSTLDKVQAFGIKYVELAGTYNLTADQFKKELA